MKHKFTLIELIIVIAIIGILITLLLPSLAMTKKKAINSVCLSNLSQLAKVHYAFAKDKNHKIIGFNTAGYYWEIDNFGEQVDHWWMGRKRPLNPYIQEDYLKGDKLAVVECPSETINYNNSGTSYASNVGYFNGAWGDRRGSVYNNNATVFLMDMVSPDMMVMVQETQAYWRIVGRTHTEGNYNSHFNDKSRLNVAMTDGSVKSQIKVLYNAKAGSTHNFNKSQ